MGFDVISRFANKLGVIVKPSDSLVAMRTQKPANFSGSVAMIDCKTLRSATNNVPLRAFADRAHVILRGEHGVIIRLRDHVFSKRVLKFRAHDTDTALFGASVAVSCCFRAIFARRLQAVRSFSAVFVKIRNGFFNTAFSARFRDAVANRPLVLGMMRVIWHRMTFNPPTFGAAFGCYRGDLAAATFAKMLFAHGERYNTEKV